MLLLPGGDVVKVAEQATVLWELTRVLKKW